MLLFMPFRLPSWVKNLLILMPLLEIVGFVIVGKILGLVMTLLLILLSTIAGMRILSSFGTIQMSGQNLGTDSIDMSLRMLAGILLIVPGFITDMLGLLLLTPFIRFRLSKYLQQSGQVHTPNQESPNKHSPQIIEGECWKEEDN